VHAELIHVERHTPKWVLGPQLLDKVSELVFVDGFREGHEQIQAISLGNRHSTGDGGHIQQGAVTLQRLTPETPGTVEVSLLREHYLVEIHDIVVVGIYPGQFLVALDKFFLYPFGVTAFPDFADFYPFYLYPILGVQPAQYPPGHALGLELAVEQANAVLQG
jgi:hypothetical protein